MLRLGMLCLVLAGCTAGGEGRQQVGQEVDAIIAAHPDRYTHGTSRAVAVMLNGEMHGLIWGTFHIGYSEDTMLPVAMRDRLAGAADLTEETVFDLRSVRAASVTAYARAESRKKSDEAALARLDPETRARLDAIHLSEDYDENSLETLTAAVNAQSFRQAGGGGTPVPTGATVDSALASFARVQNKRVFGLETASLHLAPVIEDPNGPISLANLRTAINRYPTGRTWVDYALEQYAQGRIDRTVATLSEWKVSPADQPVLDAFARHLVDDRNIGMADRLDRRFRRPGLHFVAIGAWHLLGVNGVPALLERKGWQIAPCVDDRC